MKVKGQLEDAQVMIFADRAVRDAYDAKIGMICFVEETGRFYFYQGIGWFEYKLETAPVAGIGDIRASILDESAFQAQNGSEWILADGRPIGGSDLAALTGSGVAPDLRGVFLRGKDNGKGLTSDVATGTYSADTFASHSHGGSSTATESTITITGPTWCYTLDSASPSTPKNVNKVTFGSSSVSSAGSSETKPKNVTVNYFIKINN